MRDVFGKFANLDAGRVLDVATGRGEFIHVIKQVFASYTQIIGIDSSEKAVQYTEKLFPENNIEIYKMDAFAIRFEDAYFDTVCISNSLHHLADLDKAFTEIMRILKPGGMLLVCEMYRDGVQSEAQKTHTMMHHWISEIDRISGVYHAQTYLKEEILGFISSLPCDRTEVEDYYQPVDNPKDAKNCESLLNNCNEALKRLENLGSHPDLLAHGKKLKDRINEIGCASASRLLITTYKK